MKKALIIPVLLLFTIAAFAQKENAIKGNILSPVLKVINVQYERAMGEKGSAQLGFYYINTAIFGSETRFKGLGITPEYRIYPGGTPLEGFFVGPFLRWQNIEVSDELTDTSADVSFIGGGVIVGKQWLFGESVTFETFIGPQYSAAGDLKLSAGAQEDSFDIGPLDGFGLRFGITLGFPF